jgi:hypothetical protein
MSTRRWLAALCTTLVVACSDDAPGTSGVDAAIPVSDARGADAPGSLADAAPADAAPARALRVFVTREQFGGDLAPASGGAGAARGDRLCTSAAAGAGLGGSWRALLPEGTATGVLRVTEHTPGPWYRTDGTLAFQRNFGTGPLVAIDRDEHGAQIVSDILSPPHVWTGVQGPQVALHCNDFSSVSEADEGIVGDFTAAGSGPKWQTAWRMACSKTARLYCFEI